MTVLHLLTARDPARAWPLIERQRGEPDVTVHVVLLPGAGPSVPETLAARRVPDDLPYEELLDLIFASDQVIAW